MDERKLAFIMESNSIEGICREPTKGEMSAHDFLWSRRAVDIEDMEKFVTIISEGDRIRSKFGEDVRVGRHIAPRGGSAISFHLDQILNMAHGTAVSPYRVHIEYEKLHPFTDGNGRSGRALWAWQMMRLGRDPFILGFLHRWYYDSLDHGR